MIERTHSCIEKRKKNKIKEPVTVFIPFQTVSVTYHYLRPQQQDHARWTTRPVRGPQISHLTQQLRSQTVDFIVKIFAFFFIYKFKFYIKLIFTKKKKRFLNGSS